MENKQQQYNRPVASNFFAMNDFSKLENGNYGVKGLLTIFDNEVSNYNGYVYHSGCYDSFCKNYYEANKKNIPLDILHNTEDIHHLAGKVTEFSANENEVNIVAEVSKHAVLFNNIVGLIEDGILQGFSDLSFVSDYTIDNTTGLFHVKQCEIFSVALVQNPAVVKSTLEAINSTRFNFGNKKEEKKSVFFGI